MCSDNRLSPSEVIKQLLQHVGSMCLHQINNDFLHTPLCTYILEQHPVDLSNMERVCDILEKAIQDQDRRIIICVLIILQVCPTQLLIGWKTAAYQKLAQNLGICCTCTDFTKYYQLLYFHIQVFAVYVFQTFHYFGKNFYQTCVKILFHSVFLLTVMWLHQNK